MQLERAEVAAFDAAYKTASETGSAEDWMHAALLGQQMRKALASAARGTLLLTEMDVIALLRAEIRAAGGQAAFARARGLTRQQVNDVESIRKAPTKAVLDSLDLMSVPRYAKRRTLPKEAAHAG